MTTASNSDNNGPPAENLGTAGPFRLESIIAQGGAGTVYRGVQEFPLRRVAAIKVLREGIHSSHIRQRFDAERQLLTKMHHPNVEGIFDAGTTGDGRPWFAMPLIDGSPITTHCDETRLSLSDRLLLFLEVCAGVSHAHSKGIIHRDLKPGNILVERRESMAIPKVIDFGIAKFQELDMLAAVDMTAHGAFLGTLAYASPEQAAMGSACADARSDVFSLGALLHELLCGLSHHTTDLSALGLLELARFEPTRMSVRATNLARSDAARLERLAARRDTVGPSLVRELRGDLDAIVMTALEPDPLRRYGTVDALASDVRRMLEGRPIEATPPTRRYLFSRLVKRHRLAAIAIALALATLFIAIGVLSWMFVRQREISESLADASYYASISAADGGFAHGDVATAVAALALAPPSRRAFEWNYCMRLADGTTRQSENLEGQAYCVRHSPDHSRVAAISGNTISILDAVTLERLLIARIDGVSQADLVLFGELWWVSWSPDGTRIAAGAHNGGFGVWDASTAKVIAITIKSPVGTVGEWVDDATIVLGSNEGELALVDAATLAVRVSAARPFSERVVAIAPPHDGPIYAASLHTFAAFDPVTLDELWRVEQPIRLAGIALDPKGERIAIANKDAKPVSIYNARDGSLLTEIPGTEHTWQSRWSPEGKVLWTAGFDQRVLAHDGETYARIRSFAGAPSQVWAVNCADEESAVTGGVDGILRFWKLDSKSGRTEIKLSQRELTQCAFSADGQLAVICDASGVLYCVDLQSMRVRWKTQPGSQVIAVRVIEGLGILALAADGSLRRIDVSSGSSLESVDTGIFASNAVFAHDGSALFVASAGDVTCVERESGRRRWHVSTHAGHLESMAISHDDSLIAVGPRNQAVELIDATTGRTSVLRSFGPGSRRVQFAQDGKTVWMCTEQSKFEAVCQDVKTGETLKCFGGAPTLGTQLTVAQHAPRAAIRSNGGEIRVFDTDNANGLLRLTEPGVSTVPVFAPWADRLLLLRADGVLECLDGTALQETTK